MTMNMHLVNCNIIFIITIIIIIFINVFFTVLTHTANLVTEESA